MIGLGISPFIRRTFQSTFIFLLDLYPGATIAYSDERKLSSTYIGPCLRIRRSSDNTETDIGFVNNRLDRTSLLAFCGAGDGFVKIRYDQSGNANHLVQTTAASQPQIVQAGAIVETNTKAGMFLAGTDDYMTLTTQISDAPNWSVFQTGKRYAAATMGAVLSSSTGGAPFAIMEYVDDFVYLRSNTGTRVSSSSDTSIDQKVYAAVYNATSGYVWKNEVSIATGGNATGGTGDFVDFGRRETVYARCFSQEFIMYASDQTANVTAISANMADFYSVYIGSQATPGYKIDIVGQSNGTDRSLISDGLPLNLQGVQQDSWVFHKSVDDATDNGKWQLLNTGVNTTPGGGVAGYFGFGLIINNRLKSYSKAGYIVPCAVGGTGLDNAVVPGWYPTHVGEYYARSLTNSTQAKTKAALLAPQEVLLISQGEFDAGTLAYANNYEANLTLWINTWRADKGNANLKVVLLQLSSNTIYTYRSTVRTAQANVAANLSNVYLIDCTPYALLDGEHFTAAARIELGNAIGDLIATF